MITSNGNGEIIIQNWKFLVSIITVMAIFFAGVGYVVATRGDVNNLQDDVSDLEEITVPRPEYEKDIDHIEEKMDYIHEDVKEIKELIKNGNGR